MPDRLWQGTYPLHKKLEGEDRYISTGHRIFFDRDVGFKPQDALCLQDHSQDDDVDTDEDIFETALRACSRDFNDARTKLDRHPPYQLVNNFEIRKRVQ